jgi:CVNH domain
VLHPQQEGAAGVIYRRRKEMRYFTTVAMFIMAMVLLAPTRSNAMQTPSGSYQQTCRDIGVRGSTLYAECRDAGNNWRRTELRDFERCGGQIDNINGNLQCSAGADRGGYDHNRDRDHHGDGDRDHDRYGDRDRDHDRDRYGYNQWPRGSYQQTCQNISVNGNTLQASCQKRNGKYKNTSLHNFQRCGGDIANENGKLQCR